MAKSDVDDELVEAFRSFVRLSAAGKKLNADEECQMNSKACGKLVKDCLPKQVGTIADASIFPKYKIKGKQHMDVRVDGEKFVKGCALEYARQKKNKPQLPEDDDEVTKCYQEFRTAICSKKPNVTQTKISKTGGVEKMTDTSQYTGTSKERFDKDGKGRGKEGHEDIHENTGYTLQYKNKDTFGKKK